MIQLRLRSPTGTSTLSLQDDATLADLRAHVEQAAGIPPARQELRVGFPPKPIDPSAAPTASLSSLGVKSGETIVVAEGAVVDAGATASSSSSTVAPASVPQKRAVSPSAVPSARKAPTAQLVAPPQASAASDGPPFVEVDGGCLVLRQVPDDNSCLFRAVGLVLHPGETDVAASLRRVVAGAIQANPDEYSEAMLGRPPAQYIETILRPGSWGGAIELAVFAKHFRAEIWSIDVQTGRVDRFGEGAGFETFALIVYSGIHYDALTFSFAPPEPSTSFPPPNLDFDTTVFPRYQEHLLDAAHKLVAQLRAKHAYTDTASFTLKCGDCGQALTGEKEARKHAEATGHTSFTEYDG
ncbi:ubiquitin-specific protease otu1 [Rhodotorula kratochvilovae]